MAHGAGERTAEAAVLAVVGAVVAHIQRGKEDDAITVDIALQRTGRFKDFLHQFRALCAEQNGGFFYTEGFLAQTLGNHATNRFGIFLQSCDHRFKLDIIDKIDGICAECRVHLIHKTLTPCLGRAFSCKTMRTCRTSHYGKTVPYNTPIFSRSASLLKRNLAN